MTEPQQPQKKSRLSIIKDLILPPDPNKRIEDAYGIMKEVGGFRPIFNVKDTEQRRSELINSLFELEKIEYEVRTTKDKTTIQTLQDKATFQAYKLAKLFNLFFATGSPWVRGLDNSDLSNAVACYIMNYEDFGNLPSALPDLHAESMQLLHLSWQGIDVTNTPGYIIQVMQPQHNYNPMMPTSGGETSETYQVRKPKGGPYPDNIENKIE
jgi:hypothetical protein